MLSFPYGLGHIVYNSREEGSHQRHRTFRHPLAPRNDLQPLFRPERRGRFLYHQAATGRHDPATGAVRGLRRGGQVQEDHREE